MCNWSLGIVPETFVFDHVPIWIKLVGLPLTAWTTRGLCWVASGVGRLVCFDKQTESIRRLDFARVCVEVGVYDVLPSSLSINIA